MDVLSRSSTMPTIALLTGNSGSGERRFKLQRDKSRPYYLVVSGHKAGSTPGISCH